MPDTITRHATRSTLRECVDRGVRLLDENRQDWREKIDPVRVNLSDAHCCILGQVFDEGPFAVESGYWIGAHALDIWDNVRIVEGRMIDDVEWYGFLPGRLHDFEALTDEWLRRLG